MSERRWQPSANRTRLEARAQLNRLIRTFFEQRGVLEVETPLLSHASGSDPNLHPFQTVCQGLPDTDGTPLFLQTSPEFAMKRLLAAGSGPIYQLGKAFRNGESGSRHNPEFTMLEWYRPGFSLVQLMDEVEALVAAVLGASPAARCSYRELFDVHLHIDPHQADTAALAALAASRLDIGNMEGSRDTWLDLLYSQLIEPRLQEPVFIYNWPASQAALARVVPDSTGVPVAQRFELVIGGIELANGYDELLDAAEQRARMDADLALRQARGLPTLPMDTALLAALEHGLPACAGVALGTDRLLMLQTGAITIAEVLAFEHARA